MTGVKCYVGHVTTVSSTWATTDVMCIALGDSLQGVMHTVAIESKRLMLQHRRVSQYSECASCFVRKWSYSIGCLVIVWCRSAAVR